MKTSALILSSFIVIIIATIISYEIQRSFKAKKLVQDEAFNGHSKTEVVKGMSNAWKPVIFDATEKWIFSGNAEGWKAAIENGAVEDGITVKQSVDKSLNWLWNNNVMTMFNLGMKNDVGGDQWRFYWVVGTANDKFGIKSLGKSNPVTIAALSTIQNQPPVPQAAIAAGS